MMLIDPKSLSPGERLLWDYGCRSPEHVDLEAIANDRGARVVYRCMDGCAARLVADGQTAVISIEERDNAGRRNFSLGHELAHWINDTKKSSFSCSADAIGPQNAETKSVEAAANYYASQLVLPDYMVKPWMTGKKINLSVATELAATFSASVTASAIKLVKRSENPACVVCHNQRGRRWFSPSKSWPFDLYLRNELHQDTVAFSIVFGASNRMMSPKKDKGDWWLTGPDVHRMTVESQSMKLPDDSVLSMLVLLPQR